MKKSYIDKKIGIIYTPVGEVYLPNLVSTETNYEIGMWGCGCPGAPLLQAEAPTEPTGETKGTLIISRKTVNSFISNSKRAAN